MTGLVSLTVWENAPDMLRRMFGGDRLVLYWQHDRCSHHRRPKIDFVVVGDPSPPNSPLYQWAISQHDTRIFGSDLEALIKRWNDDVVKRIREAGIPQLQYQELDDVDGYKDAINSSRIYNYQRSFSGAPWLQKKGLPNEQA